MGRLFDHVECDPVCLSCGVEGDLKGGCLLRIMKQTKKETMDGSRVFHSCDYRRKKPVAGEGQPATPAPCAAAAERRAINL